MRRVLLVVVLGSGLVVFGCVPEAGPPPSPTPTTASPSTTFPPMSTTDKAPPAESGQVGLFWADPRTLEPIPASDPLTTGDAIWGSASPNGDWLVLNVWYDGSPETDIVRVVNVPSGAVVSEADVGAPQYGLDIADDGTVYRLAGVPNYRVEVLAPGTDAFADLLSLSEGFNPWSSTEILSANRLGWTGRVVSADGPEVFAVGIADITTGDFELYGLPGVALEGDDRFDVGDWAVGEYYQPGVVWSDDDSKVYVVHADEPIVTEIDLTSGNVVEHDLETSTTWLNRLIANWNPVALAKGPEAGAIASAALDPEGQTLYVASEIGEFVSLDDGDWHVEWTPQGVQAIDLATWEVVDTWDVPTAQVSLTPDGDKLVGWGVTRKDSIDTTIYTGHPVVIIDTETRQLVGEVELPYDDVRLVSFSDDGSYAYFTQWDQTYLSLDLSTNAVVGTYTLPWSTGSFFGESGLIAVQHHAGS